MFTTTTTMTITTTTSTVPRDRDFMACLHIKITHHLMRSEIGSVGNSTSAEGLGGKADIGTRGVTGAKGCSVGIFKDFQLNLYYWIWLLGTHTISLYSFTATSSTHVILNRTPSILGRLIESNAIELEFSMESSLTNWPINLPSSSSAVIYVYSPSRLTIYLYSTFGMHSECQVRL